MTELAENMGETVADCGCNCEGPACGNERTILLYRPFPADQQRRWFWHADGNVLQLAAELEFDEDARAAAISEVQREWRRQFIKVVPAAAGDASPAA